MEPMIAIFVLIVLLIVGAMCFFLIWGKKHVKETEKLEEDAKNSSEMRNSIVTNDATNVEEKKEEEPVTTVENIIAGQALSDAIVDSMASRKTIRVTKITRLLNSGIKFQRISPKLFESLWRFDRCGFYFYRWKLDVLSSDEGIQIINDLNALEKFSLRELLEKNIPIESIDLIAYGQDNFKEDLAQNLIPQWWEFDKMIVFDPQDLYTIPDIQKFLLDLIHDREFIVSSDCLLSLVNDLEGTVYDTESLRHSIKFRADVLATPESIQELTKVKKILEAMKTIEPEEEIKVEPVEPEEPAVEEKEDETDE